MADYFVSLFISKLPYCQERTEVINGVKQTCLVIPCDDAQMVRTRGGAWCVKMLAREVQPNPQMRSNRLSLVYRTNEEAEKAERAGVMPNSNNLGYLYFFVKDEELKLDLTNNMTPITCNGRLFLDSIQKEDIKVDPLTGRKYVDFIFRKTRLLDAFGNSHEIMAQSSDCDHQIGVAKEIPLEKAPNGITTLPDNNQSKADKGDSQIGGKSTDPIDSYEW